MSTLENFLDTNISSPGLGELDSESFLSSDSGNSCTETFREPGYEGAIDYRIRQLSYSALLTLHTCPRKFQLNRLRSTHRTEEDTKSTITFAFGHIVGEAIQLAIEGRSEEEIIWKIFLGWHTDLANVDEKADKSFWTAVFALQKFRSICSSGFLKDYELVYVDGKPACELSFAIVFPDGFRLRGFVDAVLRHRITGEILVLECKTTGSTTLNPATYKNSSQAIGYSVVLDHIFPELSSYKVLYLVYQTKQKEYTPIPFVKTFLQRALWIRELLLDIEVIKMYEQEGVYPMRGENCFNFFRECEYFQTCTLSTEYQTKPCTPEEEDKTDYQIVLTLEDLLDSQLRKVEG
jgi:PD-(D/E)XK nuclease superfamily